MRIWDISPGYLNRGSLLGEHRELHGIVSIIVHGKKGYSRHPETMRWVGYGWALQQRHRLLACEMALRGYRDKSPVRTHSNKEKWPEIYIDEPAQQYRILQMKYHDKEQGRIPLPQNGQQLWSHHKYSVLARDVNRYLELGREVSRLKTHGDYRHLAMELTALLRSPPLPGGLKNALQHMWGHVSTSHTGNTAEPVESWSLYRLAAEIQQRAITQRESYLLVSTGLSELTAWLPEKS